MTSTSLYMQSVLQAANNDRLVYVLAFEFVDLDRDEKYDCLIESCFDDYLLRRRSN